jgi:endoglucanase Acf2
MTQKYKICVISNNKAIQCCIINQGQATGRLRFQPLSNSLLYKTILSCGESSTNYSTKTGKENEHRFHQQEKKKN